MKKIILGVILGGLFVGGSVYASDLVSSRSMWGFVNGPEGVTNIYRIVDKEYGNVCYVGYNPTSKMKEDSVMDCVHSFEVKR